MNYFDYDPIKDLYTIRGSSICCYWYTVFEDMRKVIPDNYIEEMVSIFMIETNAAKMSLDREKLKEDIEAIYIAHPIGAT